jgi:hypothetical protein
MREYLTVWKAFRRRNDRLCFLFRGHFGSLTVPMDTWLVSKSNLVRDGKGRRYRAGFHVLKDMDIVDKFNRLTKGKYCFAIVHVRGIRPKPRSRTGVWLARELFVPSCSRPRKRPVVVSKSAIPGQ